MFVRMVFLGLIVLGIDLLVSVEVFICEVFFKILLFRGIFLFGFIKIKLLICIVLGEICCIVLLCFKFVVLGCVFSKVLMEWCDCLMEYF